MQALRCARRAVPALTPSSSRFQPLRSQFRTFTNMFSASRASLTASPLIPSSFTSTTARPTSYTVATTTTTTNVITNTLSTQTRSFSASACLAGKRATYNPSRRVQKRRHGFLARLRSRSGREILKRRRLKGRKALSW